MGTYTLYEYHDTAKDGSPVQPPTNRVTGLAFSAARQLGVGTRYAEVIPDTDSHLRVSTDGSASTSGDTPIYANVPWGFTVGSPNNQPPYIYIA